MKVRIFLILFSSTFLGIFSMKFFTRFIAFIIIAIVGIGCSKNADAPKEQTQEQSAPMGGQASVVDNDSQKDVVKVAAASADHTTLVAAVKAGELLDALSNTGPFTVFAPTNAAFDQLPAGTVETLLKPENKEKLVDILQHHVAVAVYETERFSNGQVLGMVDGNNATITQKGNDWYIDDAKIVGSVRASNGIVHVIDKVVLVK